MFIELFELLLVAYHKLKAFTFKAVAVLLDESHHVFLGIGVLEVEAADVVEALLILIVDPSEDGVVLNDLKLDVVELLFHHQQAFVFRMGLGLWLFVLIGFHHQTAVLLPLLFAGNELRNVVSAEGIESDAEVTFEYLVAVDDFSAVEA